VIVDPDREATIDDDFYHCLCEVSIYRGWRVKGLARTALVRGRVMMDDFETVDKPGWGRYVPRGPAGRAPRGAEETTR
jgi:dihydropyrimidinase